MFGKMKVTYLDGTTVEVDTRKSDGIRFERQFHKSTLSMLNEAGSGDLNIEHLWYFAYCGVMRSGDPRTFDEWWDTVDEVEVVAAPKAKSGTRTRKPSP